MPFKSIKLRKYATVGNILSRLEQVEDGARDNFVREIHAEQISDISDDLGTMVAGEFISPSSTATSSVPTDSGFTGAAMGGDGWTFGASTYQFVGVAAGVLQAGIATDGKFYAGVGAVEIDADGIQIEAGAVGSSDLFNRINWEVSGTVYAHIVDFYDATDNTMYIRADDIASKDTTITVWSELATGQLATINLYSGPTGGPGGGIHIHGGTSNVIEINPNSYDANTIIYGDTTTIATFDAGLEQAIISKLQVTGFLNLGTPTELTISGGVVTATQTRHSIDTEGDAVSDDLDTINGGSPGDILILNSANAGRDPTLKDGTGNLYLAGDFTFTAAQDKIVLQYSSAPSAGWYELSRSDNA